MTAMKIRLKNLVGDVDRNGNTRYYVRIKGKRKVRIREAFGTDAFMRAYHAALDGAEPKQSRTSPEGSLRQVCVLYYGSREWKALDPETQRWRRRMLDDICLSTPAKSNRERGGNPVALMQGRHVRIIRDEKADHPVVANQRLKALRALFAWAIERELVPHNPTLQVQLVRYRSEGHHSWSPDEVERFEAHHPVGMKARLAMALMLYTACRREDVVRLGPQHLRNGRITYTQAKGEHRNPVRLDIPVHPELMVVIEATPSAQLTFLVTPDGRPYSLSGFGKWFRRCCVEAGLGHCSAHGLRKATATWLALRGCTSHEIMAITGHKSLAEVERYTRAVQQRTLADVAMAKLKRGTD